MNHDWCPSTSFCERCGISMIVFVELGQSCRDDVHAITAIRARSRLKKLFEIIIKNYN